MSVNKVNSDGSLSRVAGRGKAEYGASTVRKGSVSVTDIPADGSKAGNVIFDTPMPDADYEVSITVNNWIAQATVSSVNKTARGFTVYIYNEYATPQNADITYKAFKLYTDNEYNGLLNNQRYSTDEINTGKTWIDGKPIYRRVYSGIMPSSIISSSRQEFVLINELSTDKEDLVNVGGYFDLWDSRGYLRRYNTNTAFPTADLKIQLGFVCGLVNGKLTASAYSYDADYYRVTSSCKFNIVVEYP